LDELRRQRTRRRFAPDLEYLLQSEWTLEPALQSDQLRMMFSCCHPRIPEEAQVALVLHILCGFGVGEVAAAFLSGRAAIEKRMSRAKRVLASSRRLFDLERDDLLPRLGAVHRALYLLFNEGYHGANPERSVREELCQEAMRCVGMLLQNPSTRTSATLALSSLMSFHLARLAGRLDSEGRLIPLEKQDRSLWDDRLVAQGQALLDEAFRAADGPGPYHFEAAIAGAHASTPHARETPWREIVALYDGLMRLQPTPVVALNRAMAIGHAEGPERGLEVIHAIEAQDVLRGYPFYSAAIAELELRCGRPEVAKERFRDALGLARNPAERQFIEERMRACSAALSWTGEGT
jgi:RNA polymerase sigma-70 factor (ECF subfamily)